MGNVASLEEVSGLEDLLMGHAVLLDGLLEPGTHGEELDKDSGFEVGRAERGSEERRKGRTGCTNRVD